jgi:hypothetical protein
MTAVVSGRVQHVGGAVLCALTLVWIVVSVLAAPHREAVKGQLDKPATVPLVRVAAVRSMSTFPIDAPGQVNPGWRYYKSVGATAQPHPAATGWYLGGPDTTVLIHLPWASPLTRLTAQAVDAGGRLRTVAIRLPSSGSPWTPVTVPDAGAGIAFRLLAATYHGGVLDVSQPYSARVDVGAGLQASARIALTTVGAVTLLLGPGFVLAAWRRRPVDVLTVPLPGVLILTGVGLAGWAAGGWRQVTTFSISSAAYGVALTLTVVVAAVLFLAWLRIGNRVVLSRSSGVVLAVFGLVLVVAICRASWSGSPPGELLGGSISRVLENGDRPDARTSYYNAAIALGGIDPFGSLSRMFFAPYSFGDRGPVPGLAAVPLIVGGHGRSVGTLTQPWQPFDPQGFAAYRIALETMNLFVLLGVSGVSRRLAGRRAAIAAALLAGLTPFVLHETYFTWPKMMAAFFVMVAAGQVIRRRYFTAGAAMIGGYLCHPLAMLWICGLLLLVVWRERRHVTGRRAGPLGRSAPPTVFITAAAKVLAAPFVVGLGWTAFTSHFQGSTNPMLSYVRQADGRPVTGVTAWLVGRAHELATTLLPGYAVYWKPARLETATAHGVSTNVQRWALQYWTTLPFAFGLLGVPLLVWALVIAWRRDWLAITAAVVVPFLTFIVFWGSFASGSMREGLHPFLATLIVVCAVSHTTARPTIARTAVWAIACGRWIECILMIAGAMIIEHRPLITTEFAVTDIAAIASGLAALALLTIAAVRADRIATWTEAPLRGHASPSIGATYAPADPRDAGHNESAVGSLSGIRRRC